MQNFIRIEIQIGKVSNGVPYISASDTRHFQCMCVCVCAIASFVTANHTHVLQLVVNCLSSAWVSSLAL